MKFHQEVMEIVSYDSIISHITINGIKTYKPKTMTNEFGKFYSTLGSESAKKIPRGSTHIDSYLATIKRIDASLVLNPVTQPEIEKIISALPNKTSHGHDKISKNLLKTLS